MSDYKQAIAQLINEHGKERKVGLHCLMDSDLGQRFIDSPASSKTGFHCAYEQGLPEHSIRVFNNLFAQNTIAGNPYDSETILICGLFHDLGKAGNRHQRMYMQNITKSGEPHKSQPYKINRSYPQLSHEMRSVMLLSHYIELTDEEAQAISYHAWLYGDIGTRSIRNWDVEQLSFMTHVADIYATFQEKDSNK